MKTFTSLLSVNRLLTSLLTFILLTASVCVSAQPASNVYAISSDATVTTGIEYASLVATANEKSVFINWVTASEQNNSHFEVERSLDMKEFKTVAMVLDGFSANGTGKSYKFKEEAGAVRKGKTVYYRLKQIDTDNQVHYSTVMAVQMNAVVSVYPTADALSLPINNNNTFCIQSVNPNGQILLSKQSEIKMGL